METVLASWENLSPQVQFILSDIGKIALLLAITLACVNKLRQWLIPFKLEECFKLLPLDKKKYTPTKPWLSTTLAYGLCFSLASILNNAFIMQAPLWTATQNELLVKFWGALVFYLLLMSLLKQFFIAVTELCSSPAIEKYIENLIGDTDSNARYESVPASARLVHFSTFVLYSSIAWLLGFMLVIELFDLQLLSGLISGLFINAGKLLIALLMLFLGLRFYTHQTDKDTTHTKFSSLVLVCCVFLGTLIIGGSSIIISGIPWLFLLIALWYFLISPDKEDIADFVAGIYLKLTPPLISDEVETIHIDKLGFIESKIRHTSGKQETIKNSKLLSICSNSDSKEAKDKKTE